MLKTLRGLLALVCLLFLPIHAAPRINKIITLISGTPVQVSATSILADRLLIQAAAGGTHIVYVCIVGPGVTPASNCGTAGQLAAQLAPATATAPGGSYSDFTYPGASGPLDVSFYWLCGTTDEQVIFSFDQRN